MTTDARRASWPDHALAGLPPQAGQDGIHILLIGQPPGLREAARWSAATREWWLPGSTLPKSPEWAGVCCGYVSPVRTEGDLHAAYDRGVADGREAAMATVAESQRIAVRNALQQHDDQLLAARRQGAETMRAEAADVARSNDPHLLASRLRVFRDGAEPADAWYQRLHVAAIRALKLPGDA